jgi:hypothetical protein
MMQTPTRTPAAWMMMPVCSQSCSKPGSLRPSATGSLSPSAEGEVEIIAEHPGLEHEDFLAVHGYTLLVGEFAGVGERMREIRAEVKAAFDPKKR